jgi:uncharacterized membrane protein
MIEEIFYQITRAVEVVSFVIMIYGVLLAILMFVKNEFKRFSGSFKLEEVNSIRLDFSYYILLGLEFLIAADIIETILKPSSQELIELGGIVAIRILLSYFLTREINDLKKQDKISA